MIAGRVLRSLIAMLAVSLLALSTGCAYMVILHDPLTADEHNDLGVVYESNGQLDLAAREYRKAIRLEPRQARARVNLGNVEAAAGRWAKAERSYRLALRESPADPDAMNNLAVALLRQGRGSIEARTLAERAVAAGTERDSVYRATLAEVEQSLKPGSEARK